MKKALVLSSFILKIIAILTMTLDHVGLIIEMSNPANMALIQLASIFRLLGRLSFPLFIFMIVEGVIHTKNIKKYFLRLGILAAIISLFFIVIEYSSLRKQFPIIPQFLRSGNIFLELLLAGVAVYALTQKGWKKLLILLPLGLSITSFVVKGLENSTVIDIYWFPAFLTLTYDWVGIILAILFYLSYYIADTYISITYEQTKLDKESWILTGNYRLLVNIISVLMLIVVGILYYLFIYIWPKAAFVNTQSAMVQLFSIISGAFILLYNGKRGYNAKWFQIGAYIYYPAHIIILFAIFVLINGGL